MNIILLPAGIIAGAVIGYLTAGRKAAALKTQVQETAGLEESQRGGLLASLDAAQQNLAAATRKRAAIGARWCQMHRLPFDSVRLDP